MLDDMVEITVYDETKSITAIMPTRMTRARNSLFAMESVNSKPLFDACGNSLLPFSKGDFMGAVLTDYNNMTVAIEFVIKAIEIIIVRMNITFSAPLRAK